MNPSMKRRWLTQDRFEALIIIFATVLLLVAIIGGAR